MSIEALRWAFSADIPTGPKFILVALADYADTQGICFPGVATLMKRTSMSRSGVRLALRQLINDFQIVTVVGGATATTSKRYQLHVGAVAPVTKGTRAHRAPEVTGALSVPGSLSAPGPNGHAGTQREPPGSLSASGDTQSASPPGSLSSMGGYTECPLTPTEPNSNPAPTPGDGGAVVPSALPLAHCAQASSPDGGSRQKAARRAPGDVTARGSRLPRDWRLNDEEAAYAREVGVDPDKVAEDFRDWWLAAPSAKGVKADWTATWRGWCRKDKERGRNLLPPNVLHFGPRPAAAPPPAQASPPAAGTAAWHRMRTEERAAKVRAKSGLTHQGPVIDGTAEPVEKLA